MKKVDVFDMAAKKRERCLQEVQVLKQMQHPHIIEMLDSFLTENTLVIVFEWAAAGDLKRLLKRQLERHEALPEATVWRHYHQVANALRYMHDRRVMHRDIKPANVLVAAEGLKLGDLGLGRHFSTQTMEAYSKVGTPCYVSPEVVQGTGYDWKSDLWSLGCLLHEMSTLVSPFETEGANLYHVFKRISKGEYTPLSQQRFSRPLYLLARRLMSVDPAHRPELAEVIDVTERAIESIGSDPFALAEDAHGWIRVLPGSRECAIQGAFLAAPRAAALPTPHSSCDSTHGRQTPLQIRPTRRGLAAPAERAKWRFPRHGAGRFPRASRSLVLSYQRQREPERARG